MQFRARFITIVSTLLMVTAPLWSAAADRQPAAMLSDQRGGVKVLAPGGTKWQSMETLGLLDDGTRLRLDAGGLASLSFLVGGIRAQLRGPCEVKVDTNGCKLVTGKRNQLTLQRPAQATAATLPGGVNLDRMGGLRRGPITIKGDPATLSSRPVIAWESRDIYGTIQVVVEDAQTEKRLVDEKLPGAFTRASLKLPDGVVLSPGDYYVYIIGLRADGTRSSMTDQPFPLRVLDASVSRQIEKARARAQAAPENDLTAWSELLCVYMHYDLYTPALEVAELLHEARPNDKALTRIYERLREQVGPRIPWSEKDE